MEHIFLKGSSNEIFVLFHGTGGNEHSLLFLSGELDSQAPVLSYLGDVGVGINRRYFLPLVDGKVVREDFESRVNSFLNHWEKMDLPKNAKITFIGYSNGANFILGLLQHNPNIADKTILLHPSDFNLDYKLVNSKNKILITIGSQDKIVIPGTAILLTKKLSSGAFEQVDNILLDSGHEITDIEIDKIKEWYNKN